MEDETIQDDVEQDDSIKSNTPKFNNKANAEQVEARSLEVVAMLEKGIWKNEIREKVKKEWNIKTNKQFYRYYNRALDILKEQMSGPIERVRSEYMNSMKADMTLAFKKFQEYDRLDDRPANLLALKWFETYLRIKTELATYYPGIKPDLELEKNAPQITFMVDDGKDNED